MNLSEFSQILQKPETLQPSQLRELESVIQAFPYFQAAHAVYLKALKINQSFRYNQELKTTAAYTTDRSILFEYITSEQFSAHQVADAISSRNLSRKVLNIEVDSEEVRVRNNKTDFDFNQVNPDRVLDPELFRPVKEETEEAPEEPSPETRLQLGTPLSFDRNELHSFSEWLKLSGKLQPIARPEHSREQALLPAAKTTPEVTGEPAEEIALEEAPVQISLESKMKLIDRFIENNPKIGPVHDSVPKVNLAQEYTTEREELMTETLARVYLEQKKYKKAIQAYKILSLKYPEKSGFFADQIRAIKNLKESN